MLLVGEMLEDCFKGTQDTDTGLSTTSTVLPDSTWCSLCPEAG